MRKTRLVIFATAALMALGVATSALAQDAPAAQTEPAAQEAVQAAEPAVAPEPAADPSAQAAPAADQAAAPAEEPPGRIIFFRPGRLTGAVYTYHVVEVAEDGDSTRESPRIGSLPNGQYFEAAVAPGIHNYNIRGPMAVNLDEDRLRIEVEPGETYYVEQTVRMGVFTGGFRLVPSTQADFERRRLRQWTPRESDESEGAQQGGSN